MIEIKNQSSYTIRVNYDGKKPVIIPRGTAGFVHYSPTANEEIQIEFLSSHGRGSLIGIDCEHVDGDITVTNWKILTRVNSLTIPFSHDHMDGPIYVPNLRTKSYSILIPRDPAPPSPIPDYKTTSPQIPISTSTYNQNNWDRDDIDRSYHRERIQLSQAKRERENQELESEQRRELNHLKTDIEAVRRDFGILEAIKKIPGEIKNNCYTDIDINQFFERCKKFINDYYDYHDCKHGSAMYIQSTLSYGEQILKDFDLPISKLLTELRRKIKKEVESLRKYNNRHYDRDHKKYNEHDAQIHNKYNRIYYSLLYRYQDFDEDSRKYQELSIQIVINLIKNAETLFNDVSHAKLRLELVNLTDDIQGWISNCLKKNIPVPQSYSVFLNSREQDQEKGLADLQKIYNEGEKIRENVMQLRFFPPLRLSPPISRLPISLFAASSKMPAISSNSVSQQQPVVLQSSNEPLTEKPNESLNEFMDLLKDTALSSEPTPTIATTVTPPPPPQPERSPTPTTDLFKRQPFKPNSSVSAQNYRPSGMNEPQNRGRAKSYNPPITTAPSFGGLKTR